MNYLKTPSIILWLFVSGATMPARAQSVATPQSEYAVNPTVAETNSMGALDNRRKLAAGDILSYRVIQERIDPRPIIITDSGEVEIPLIGRMPAAGRTCRELAEAIKTELEKEYFWPGHATVILGLDTASKTRGRVFLTGEVRTEGSEELPSTGDFTVTKAILQAGGFGDFADEHRVSVQRKLSDGSSQMIRVDVARVLKGAAQGDVVLQPDDIIMVPAKVINF